MFGSLVGPYLLWIKIGAAVVVLAMIVGIAIYVRSIFRERDELLSEKTRIQNELVSEKQRLLVTLEQLQIWQNTVKKMNESIRNIKIQSDVYVQGVENEKPPVVPVGSAIPFIVPGVPDIADMPGYKNYSTYRIRPAAPPS